MGPAGQPSVQLGAAYLRFSCDNSNPRSLDQQLKNVLERAARDRVFTPWNFVLADAVVIQPELKKFGWDIGMPTIRRAYDFAHRDEFREAIAQAGPWQVVWHRPR